MNFFENKRTMEILGYCRECGMMLTHKDWHVVATVVCPSCGYGNDFKGLREECTIKEEETHKRIGKAYYTEVKQC